jgi:hypothetical protein
MGEKEVVCRELPSYLAEFLKKFSTELAMTPGQLIANLLNYYYKRARLEQNIGLTAI